jgi:hypothetical protein
MIPKSVKRFSDKIMRKQDGGFVQRPGRRVLSAVTKVRVLHPLRLQQCRYSSMAERLFVEQETIGSIPGQFLVLTFA